jgi:hypothetical protein
MSTDDTEEALEDARGEVNDTAAALDGAGESAGVPAPRPQLPDGLLQHRLVKQTADVEKAIKEKELLQKDWMRCKPSWSWQRQTLARP